MRIIERVTKNLLIVACARCDETGLWNPANRMSPHCEVCHGRGKVLVRVEDDIFEECRPCGASGRSYPSNPMSSPCELCKGLGNLTRTGAAEIVPWTELPAKPPVTGEVVTIVFTDMEGSTTLTRRLGDAKAQEVLRTHNTIVRHALKAHGGSEVKTMGDGFMASFSSASRALECAIDIQRALAQHNESNPDLPIRVRIGLNAGEPVAEEEDLFGTAVQLAARIAAKAEGEEILVSDTLRGLVAGKGFLFSDRGDVALRGFEDPVRLYEVRWREEG